MSTRVSTNFKEVMITNSKKDIDFLIELKNRLIAGEKDYTQREYAMNMIDDWIGELTQSIESGQAVNTTLKPKL